MKIAFHKKELHFIKPAKTSKVEYASKEILVLNLNIQGIDYEGECAPLPHLSSESITDCEATLKQLEFLPDDLKELKNLQYLPSSLLFAIEGILLESKLKRVPVNQNPIQINGLIWMNGFEAMEQELIQKVKAGFDCIKIKIGQHDFDAECRFLEKARKRYGNKIELRVDANGAFAIEDALLKLKDLNRFTIHSIEQPIAPGQWDALEMICKDSPIDVGLDEELIGLKTEQQGSLLKKIKPQYLILKPTLHGGFANCDSWINEAQKQNTEWWATSALESNIGLYHIALWLSKYKLGLPQGLGTGSLFKTNFERPFYYEKDRFCWRDLEL